MNSWNAVICLLLIAWNSDTSNSASIGSALSSLNTGNGGIESESQFTNPSLGSAAQTFGPTEGYKSSDTGSQHFGPTDQYLNIGSETQSRGKTDGYMSSESGSQFSYADKENNFLSGSGFQQYSVTEGHMNIEYGSGSESYVIEDFGRESGSQMIEENLDPAADSNISSEHPTTDKSNPEDKTKDVSTDQRSSDGHVSQVSGDPSPSMTLVPGNSLVLEFPQSGSLSLSIENVVPSASQVLTGSSENENDNNGRLLEPVAETFAPFSGFYSSESSGSPYLGSLDETEIEKSGQTDNFLLEYVEPNTESPTLSKGGLDRIESDGSVSATSSNPWSEEKENNDGTAGLVMDPSTSVGLSDINLVNSVSNQLYPSAESDRSNGSSSAISSSSSILENSWNSESLMQSFSDIVEAALLQSFSEAARALNISPTNASGSIETVDPSSMENLKKSENTMENNPSGGSESDDQHSSDSVISKALLEIQGILESQPTNQPSELSYSGIDEYPGSGFSDAIVNQIQHESSFDVNTPNSIIQLIDDIVSNEINQQNELAGSNVEPTNGNNPNLSRSFPAESQAAIKTGMLTDFINGLIQTANKPGVSGSPEFLSGSMADRYLGLSHPTPAGIESLSALNDRQVQPAIGDNDLPKAINRIEETVDPGGPGGSLTGPSVNIQSELVNLNEGSGDVGQSLRQAVSKINQTRGDNLNDFLQPVPDVLREVEPQLEAIVSVTIDPSTLEVNKTLKKLHGTDGIADESNDALRRFDGSSMSSNLTQTDINSILKPETDKVENPLDTVQSSVQTGAQKALANDPAAQTNSVVSPVQGTIKTNPSAPLASAANNREGISIQTTNSAARDHTDPARSMPTSSSGSDGGIVEVPNAPSSEQRPVVASTPAGTQPSNSASPSTGDRKLTEMDRTTDAGGNGSERCDEAFIADIEALTKRVRVSNAAGLASAVKKHLKSLHLSLLCQLNTEFWANVQIIDTSYRQFCQDSAGNKEVRKQLKTFARLTTDLLYLTDTAGMENRLNHLNTTVESLLSVEKIDRKEFVAAVTRVRSGVDECLSPKFHSFDGSYHSALEQPTESKGSVPVHSSAVFFIWILILSFHMYQYSKI